MAILLHTQLSFLPQEAYWRRFFAEACRFTPAKAPPALNNPWLSNFVDVNASFPEVELGSMPENELGHNDA